jgi:hypothetical protein
MKSDENRRGHFSAFVSILSSLFPTHLKSSSAPVPFRTGRVNFHGESNPKGWCGCDRQLKLCILLAKAVRTGLYLFVSRYLNRSSLLQWRVFSVEWADFLLKWSCLQIFYSRRLRRRKLKKLLFLILCLCYHQLNRYELVAFKTATTMN